jgi:UDP-N-acetyl-D-mannosaminuronic acid dehydrogenase
MTSICVIGLGYIGLPTASLFANNGFDVTGVDTNPDVIKEISSGRNHIQEIGLRTLVEAAVSSGRLRATNSPSPSDVFIIAVPTPIGSRKEPDLSHVFAAANALAPHLQAGNLVIVESTVPPGTTRRLATFLSERRSDLVRNKVTENEFPVDVAHCPERVLPGSILKELVENDRVVGGLTETAVRRASELYGTIVQGKIFQTDATTAEMVKLSENTFRDVNIALSNELAVICEKLGIDVWDVIRLANKHPRVRLLSPGPGVGGHCIAVDPWFIVSEFPTDARVIRSARERNDAMPATVVARIMQLIDLGTRPKIALLGASYKGNVGDARNSPAIDVYTALSAQLKGRADIRMHDPHVVDPRLPLRPLDEVLHGADLLVILTDHNEYASLLPSRVFREVRTPVLFDTRNTVDQAAWVSAGFAVHVLGKRVTRPVNKSESNKT